MADEVQSKPNPQLDAARYALAEQVRNTHAVTVEAGLTRAQIVHPDFWGHIAARLRPYDRIEVRCDDGATFAELLVLSAERTFARVRVLAWHDLTTKDVAKTQAGVKEPVESPEGEGTDPLKAYQVKNFGAHLKWCVVRLSDAERIREREPSKTAAEAWLADYVRVITTT